MKHLKSYKLLFESFEIDDIKDMLSYLSDEQFNIQVKEGDHHAYGNCIEITISKDGGDFYFWNEGRIGELTPFKFVEVKEYLLRIFKYMPDEGWYDFNFEIVTYDKVNDKHSRPFRDDTYATAIANKDDGFVCSYYDYKNNKEVNIPIKDDEVILCVYIGFGK